MIKASIILNCLNYSVLHIVNCACNDCIAAGTYLTITWQRSLLGVEILVADYPMVAVGSTSNSNSQGNNYCYW